MKLIFSITLLLVSGFIQASVNCNGTIKEIYKWDNFETISIRVDIPDQGLTNWLSMPTKSDESMALMAFAAQKSVLIYMSEDSVTNCTDGWPHNKKLKGYFVVR